MKHRFIKWLWPTGFTLGGAGLGYLYYHFFGCSGNCAITSRPLLTMLYTGIIGLLLSGLFRREAA